MPLNKDAVVLEADDRSIPIIRDHLVKRMKFFNFFSIFSPSGFHSFRVKSRLVGWTTYVLLVPSKLLKVK